MMENENSNALTVAKTKRTTKLAKIIYYILGVLEVLFTFRLVFKILGANPASLFVSMIYSVTKLFLTPFTGIFRLVVSRGIETESVLEPPLLIAMAVYALVAWGIVKLIVINNNNRGTKTM